MGSHQRASTACAVLAIAALAGACALGGDGEHEAPDARGTGVDANPHGADANPFAVDADHTIDAVVMIDASHPPDAPPSTPDARPQPDARPNVITGGPCISGASGRTAYRVRWADGGNTAYPVYEVNGLPDQSRDHTGAYGYQIGFTPSFVDPYLGDGGLLLDSSDFVDIELSTAGVSQISLASLSIYGRSFHTTTSGSFNWQTFSGIGATPANFVSNVAPYRWYSADMTTEIDPNDNGVLLRIKAGPNSGVLVVNRIELCLVAQ